MKSLPVYLVAKYIPDLKRMEPRNIGVVLRANGKSVCRFLDPNLASGFVNDLATYERWLDFWGEQIRTGEVLLPTGKRVSSSSSEFLSALKLTQKGNYVLDDGGVLTRAVSGKLALEAVQFLFNQLVAATPPEGLMSGSAATLRVGANRILDRAGIIDRDDFKKSHEVACDIFGIQQSLRFHYFLGNGTPTAVFHRVKIENGQSVNSAAWMFERVKSSYQTNRGAIINTSDVEVAHPTIHASLAVLSQLASIVDVADECQAIETARSLAE